MANKDDLDDYMSDALLQECGDVRPGIVSRSVAKRYKVENDQALSNLKNKRQKLSVVERETREEALSKPISSDNKGFAMLSKMGYKPGMTLGKNVTQSPKLDVECEPTTSESSVSSSRALKEPISVDLKLDRKGLGHSIIEKERRARLEASRRAQQIHHKIIHNDFKSRKRENVETQAINRDLRNSQKVCFELDSRLEITPPVTWFWPEYANEREEGGSESEFNDELDDEENNEDEIDNAEKLKLLTNYLRSTHSYCVWCGVKYEHEADLSGNCPGDSKQAHDGEELSTDF